MLWQPWAQLRSAWESIRGSYWALPGAMTVVAAGLALLTVEVERRHGSWMLLPTVGSAEVARSVLVTIAGSMITVTGVVFSITIVALTLASNQFGPRLLRNFMRDRGNQLVLGTFISTFVFSLLTLRVVGLVQGENTFVPQIATLGSMGLALLSMGVLIFFIHHAANSLQASTVIGEVAEEIREQIDVVYPERLDPEQRDARDPEQDAGVDSPPDVVVRTPEAGYVRVVDRDTAIDIARACDGVVRVCSLAGHFVMAGGVLAEIRFEAEAPGDRATAGDGGGDREFDAADLEWKLSSCFAMGWHRTGVQDVDFLLHQLVEIAQRAMSSGINDPRTARSCIRFLCDALVRLGSRKLPPARRCDEDGTVRLVEKERSFEQHARPPLSALRVAARGHPEVAAELLEMIAVAAQQLPWLSRRRVLRALSEEIAEDAQRHLEAAPDARLVEDARKRALEALQE